MPALPRAIYMHIGHGKTGSSFLQSALALSADQLRDHNICYPLAADAAKAAAKGEISGGNIAKTPEAFRALIKSGPANNTQRLLLSNEGFFQSLAQPKNTLLDEIRTLCPDAPLHVLLYLRNPVDHAVSVYHQQVKRGRFTGTLADSLQTYIQPKKIITVLQRLQQVGTHVTVVNYSTHRDSLMGTMETWLDLPAGTLTVPARKQVNRSLTLAELELQRAFNQHFEGRSSRFISDPLCNDLPDIKSDTPPLAPDDLRRFLRRMHTLTNSPEFRACVPKNERPWIGQPKDHLPRFPSPDNAVQLVISPQQIAVLAKIISQELHRAQMQKQALRKAKDQS